MSSDESCRSGLSAAGGAAPRRGILLVVSAPSGGGKTAVVRRLREHEPELGVSISMTTRAPRPGEQDGRDYHFVNRETFLGAVARGELLEHAEVFGNLYGTPRAAVEAALASGRDLAFDIDWQGHRLLRAALPRDVVGVFLLPPSAAELERRLRGRAQDDDGVIRRRMAANAGEIAHAGEFDYVLVNDDFDACHAQVRAILWAERARAWRHPRILGHGQALALELARHWPWS